MPGMRRIRPSLSPVPRLREMGPQDCTRAQRAPFLSACLYPRVARGRFAASFALGDHVRPLQGRSSLFSSRSLVSGAKRRTAAGCWVRHCSLRDPIEVYVRNETALLKSLARSVNPRTSAAERSPIAQFDPAVAAVRRGDRHHIRRLKDLLCLRPRDFGTLDSLGRSCASAKDRDGYH
jgi:hypothetical protein